MKIRDIHIDGFGVWSDLAVDSLPPSMVVFYGPNEAGKTTLMQFLRTMLYGFTPQRRSRYLPPVHGGTPGGRMSLSGPGGGYRVNRRGSADGDSVVGHLTVSDGEGTTQGPHRLQALLGGIDERIFTNVFAIGLRELQELNTLDDTAAADELYKLSSGLDRVSLVDVIRKLKSARSQMVGVDGSGQMPAIMLRRDKIKEELEELSARSRRWAELAAVRRSQQKEVAEIKTRVETQELEAIGIDLAIKVRAAWNSRAKLIAVREQLAARLDLPDDAQERIDAIDLEIETKNESLQQLRGEARRVRDAARGLPLNKSVLKLATKIDVANEQGPWIAALQKQVHHLSAAVEKSREQLLADAQRLQLSEEDQDALLNDRRMTDMPELSAAAIGQLAGPAKDVRHHLSALRSSKSRIRNDKQQFGKLKEKIDAALHLRGQTDLSAALSHQQNLIANLRKLAQIDERLDRMTKHRDELERGAVDLASQSALPMERLLILGVPFVGGLAMLAAGMLRFLDLAFAAFSNTAAVWMCLLGFMLLMFFFFWLQIDERATGEELDGTESELDGFNAQLKKVQAERETMYKTLPEHGGSTTNRLLEAEEELKTLESYLPTSHNLEAAAQRLAEANAAATSARDGLRSAQNSWKRTLASLGLAESLSPKSVRMLADGYESLVSSRRRLRREEDELQTRRLELAAIDSTIDSLLRQVSASGAAAGDATSAQRASQEASNHARPPVPKHAPVPKQLNRPDARRESREGREDEARADQLETPAGPNTMEKLHRLQTVLASQQQYITRRRELRAEYEALLKRIKSVNRAIERCSRARDAVLAELAVEDDKQLKDQLERKAKHLQLSREITEQAERITTIIAGQVPYESVARLLDSPEAAADLERRLAQIRSHIEAAKTRTTELLQRQGETSQEMKSIAGDRRMLELKAELTVLERQIDMTAEHWRTLALTSSLLQRVCDEYETQRQPETLREASLYLRQLTAGRYRRVWTPLGKNSLRVENEHGHSLPVEVLSRGTREAVFVALRLSLAAAYSRRGVMLPLILDDILVNFDADRAHHAAGVLREFAALGHQTIFFTCHEHIMRMFYDIGVEVRVLPAQGASGVATVYHPAAEPLTLTATTEDQAAAPAAEAPVADAIEDQVAEPAAEVSAYEEDLLDDVDGDPVDPVEVITVPEGLPLVAEADDGENDEDHSPANWHDAIEQVDDLVEAINADLTQAAQPLEESPADWDSESPAQTSRRPDGETQQKKGTTASRRKSKKARPAAAESREVASTLGGRWFDETIEDEAGGRASGADHFDSHHTPGVAWAWDTLAIEPATVQPEGVNGSWWARNEG